MKIYVLIIKWQWQLINNNNGDENSSDNNEKKMT